VEQIGSDALTSLAYTGIAAAALIAVHLFNHQIRQLDALPRSRWLSLAGGFLPGTAA
jgi:orotate phosphoribosyltransferase